ncbi:ATP-binding cassette sub-family C member 4-like isoform X2 [Babylonia areolata]|uniref:ATP-binding cassette sub-family C member 4-like isoform X2 n=2 Tax=Babylonia areolata TaxID=304850 RepID=UPI003FCF7A0A
MDESLRHFNPNPTLSSNIFSKLLFSWLNPLFRKGRQAPLEVEDMFNVTPDDSSDHLGVTLEREWQKELKKKEDSGGRKQPSLLRALVRIFALRYSLYGILVFIEEGVRVFQPLLLGGLIRYFTPGSQVSTTEAYLYAMGVSLCAILIAITHHPYFFGVVRMGMQMRVACCSLMYKKALRLSNTAMGQTTTGQIVNLMSNDVNRFDQAVLFLHFLWIGPLQCIAVLVILWQELGPSVLAGFAVLLLLMPVQGSMGKLFSKLRRKTAIHTDERVKVMNEIISGIRVIKMYCWEKPFGEIVEKIRSLEVKRIRTARYLQALILAPNFFSVKFVLLLTFVTYVFAGGHMTPEKVFVAIAVYQAIRVPITVFIPFAVQTISEFRICCERVQNFLLLEELDQTQAAVEKSNLRPKPEDCGVVIDNLTAKWNPEVEQNTLEQISATVKAGQLLAVIGPVGAGKSSLLMAILGELLASSGSVSIKGKVAYVSQQAWIFSGSLRQNILFGQPYDKARFDKAVKASAMQKDLEIMPHGDSTLIGDRGVSLSGGQRARVSLARALYTDADIFLLDDPLSAVDAAVGRHIFEKCIQGVLRKKPRILVTHQLQYLTTADCILTLNEGKTMAMGTYEELSNSGIDFAEMLKANGEEEGGKVPVSPASDRDAPSFVSYLSQVSLDSVGSDFEPEPVQLPEEEERQKGTVGIRVYVEYFKNGAGCFKFFLLIFFNLVAQGTYIMSDWWLSIWSNAEETRIAAQNRHDALLSMGINQTNVTIPDVDSHVNISIFTGIIVAVFVFGMVRALLFFKVAVDASQTMHNAMFSRVLRCPIGFFDTNPVGRILNRFAKDVGHMDDNLPITFFDFIQCFLMIVGIVLVAGIVNPWVFIPTTPLILLFFYIRHYYLSTSRSVKRLEGTCRSPVFSYLSASLQGLHTIRAFSMERKCQEEFDAHQDLHSEAWFLFLATSRWLAVRLDWLCAIFVTAVTFLSVLMSGSMDAGLVGLSITYSMTLMGMFQWGVRQSAEVENQMISVERVLEYSQLPTEANLDSEEKRRPPNAWPSGGSIQATNVCLRYFPSAPLVLKGLTFRIREKEKVGIVGRTGAGKSSLITCLFRLVEPQGHLTIDGVDILSLGLHDLRKTISIIPQDPVLFTGTLRRNLDPFGYHGDQQLWKALSEVQLKSAVEDLPAGLETSVSEGGVNFSVGQRQLICLARAILRRNRILLIDEATANVDPKTDELIQETIRDKFRECTVLTIAHRLHTIMDSDRVMVLSEGQIMEFEAPHLLLQRGSGLLYDMVQQTGKADAEYLAGIAAEAYRQQRGEESRRSSGLESPVDTDLSYNANTKKARRLSKKSSIFDDMDLSPPIAVAESFHSLLGGGGGEDYEDDEEEESGDNDDEKLNDPGLSWDPARTGENLPDSKHPVSAPVVEESIMVSHAPNQILPAPRAPEPSQNPLNRSTLTDTSLDDDVFAEDPAAQTAVTAVPRSNFQPAANMTGPEEGGGEEEEGGQGEEEDDDNKGPLPRVESGIGTDLNGSSSDVGEVPSGVDTPQLLDTRDSERGLHPEALTVPGSADVADDDDDDEGVTNSEADPLLGSRVEPCVQGPEKAALLGEADRRDQTADRYDEATDRYDKAADRYDKATDRYDEATDRYDKAGDEAADEAADRYDEAADKAAEYDKPADEAADKADDRYDKAADVADDRYDKAADATDDRYDGAEEMVEEGDVEISSSELDALIVPSPTSGTDGAVRS